MFIIMAIHRKNVYFFLFLPSVLKWISTLHTNSSHLPSKLNVFANKERKESLA